MVDMDSSPRRNTLYKRQREETSLIIRNVAEATLGNT
jgi:hypothetical protein